MENDPSLPKINAISEEKARQQYRYDTIQTAKIKFFLNAVIPQQQREAVLRSVFEMKIQDEKKCIDQHYLSQEMVREMALAGQEFGLHTHSHLHLASASRSDRLQDMEKNLTFIHEVIGAGFSRDGWISYPYGSVSSFNADVIEDAHEIGCTLGLSMIRGINTIPSPKPMALYRLDTNDAPGGKSPMDPSSWAF